jgi:hypothetical protein
VLNYQEFDGITQAKEGIRAMNYRNDKSRLIKHIQTDKQSYLDLLNTVMKEIFR